MVYDKIKKGRRNVMSGRKHSRREVLVYTDPRTADRPAPSRHRGLRAFLAAAAALALVALVLATLYASIQGP